MLHYDWTKNGGQVTAGNTSCFLRSLKGFKEKYHPILQKVFYHFTDRKMLGGHNQKAYQPYVFERWGTYLSWTTVYGLGLVTSVVAFIVALFRYTDPFQPMPFSVPLIVFPLILFGWHRHGKAFCEDANSMADRQIDAIISCCAKELRERLKELASECTHPKCTLK